MKKNIFDLRGKTILVTGANAGIGFGMAQALAEAGGNLVIWGRRAERNREAAAELAKAGVDVLDQEVDVSNEARVREAFAAALAQVGQIDAVFANAGSNGPRMPFEELDTAEYRAIVESNQFGTVFTVREAARHMVARARAGGTGGSIAITGSCSMLWGVYGNAAYATTKGALDALTRTAAVELGQYGIRVNCILPGMIASEFAHRTASTAFITANSAMHRPGTTAELGGIAVYLASDASSYHTGDSIVIDGGLSIYRAV